jgi:hypothetical protein
MFQFLIVSLIFFFLGRYIRSRDTFKHDLVDDTIDAIVTKAKQITQNKPQAGVLPFKTPEEFALEKSGEKALDDHWIKSGMLHFLKGKK